MFHSPMNRHMMYNGPPPPEMFIIKNIDPRTEVGRIFIDVERLGYRVHSIKNAMDAATHRPVPEFLVELLRTPFNETILGMKRIANQNVIVERFSQIQQICRCRYCTNRTNPNPEEYSCFPICPRCNGPHMAWQCKVGGGSPIRPIPIIPPIPPKYCRCGRHHPPSYRGCHVYRQEIFEAKMEMLQGGPGIQMAAEDLPWLAVDDFQSEESASFASSNDDRMSVESEADYSLHSSASNTIDTEKLDYLKEHPKYSLEHYLSMHYSWRHLILKYSMDSV